MASHSLLVLILAVGFTFWGTVTPTVYAQPEQRPIDGIIMPGIYMEELDDSVAPFATYDRVVPLVFEFKVPPAIAAGGGGFFASILPRVACKNENHTSNTPPNTPKTSASPSTTDWLFTCPIFYHVNQLLGQFRTNWTVGGDRSSSAYTSSSSSSSSYRSATTFASSSTAAVQLDEECRSALRSWRGISWDTLAGGASAPVAVGLAAYKTILEKCAVEAYFEEGIQDYNMDFVGQYEKMKESLVTHFGARARNASSTSTAPGPIYPQSYSAPWAPPAAPTPTAPTSEAAGADLIGVLLGIQNLMMTQAAVEAQRWRDAATACQNALVPTSILRPAKLERALQELRVRLLPKKYTLLFGGGTSGASSLSRLYKTKLVDCILGPGGGVGGGSVFVQVLVPIVREGALYKSLRIHQPHFLYGGDFICTVASNFEAKGSRFDGNRNFIFEKSSKLLVESNCGAGGGAGGGGLCKFPDKASRPTTDGCLLAVLLGNMESIRAFCHLECDKLVSPSELGAPLPSSGRGYASTSSGTAGGGSPNVHTALGSNSFPLIQRIDSDKFIVTLASLSTLLIKCESLGRLDELLPPQKYGALEVILPCGCYLMFHAEKYPAYEPCSGSLSHQGAGASAGIHHVIPVHMINSSIEVPVLQRLNNQQIMMTPAAVSGSNLRYNMNSRLRYLQPRNRITFPNITLLVNMTFREADIVEVVDEGDEEGGDEDHEGEGVTSSSTPNPSESQGSGGGGVCPECRLGTTVAPQEYPHEHGALWALLATQAFALGLFAVFIVYKVRSIERRVEGCAYKLGGHAGHTNGGGPGVGAISFSASHPSQVTLSDKF